MSHFVQHKTEYFTLSPNIQIVAKSENEILLYKEAGKTIKFYHPQKSLVPVITALKNGVNFDLFYREGLSLFSSPSKANLWCEKIINALEEASFILPLPEEVLEGEEASDEKEYFDRLIRFLRGLEASSTKINSYQAFKNLRSSKIMLLGFGSLGATTAQMLVGLGIGEIVAVDGDKIELSNLGRQSFFRHSDCGRKKVEVGAEIVSLLSPYTKFTGIDTYINSPQDLEKLCQSTRPDLIVLTADYPSWQIIDWVVKASLNTNIPVIRANRIAVGPLFIPNSSACFMCEWPALQRNIPETEAIINLRKKHFNVVAGVANITISVIVNQLVDGIVKYLLLSPHDHPLLNSRLNIVYDGFLPTFRQTPFLKEPNCPACGINITKYQEAI